jgi:hypothetical protein
MKSLLFARETSLPVIEMMGLRDKRRGKKKEEDFKKRREFK